MNFYLNIHLIVTLAPLISSYSLTSHQFQEDGHLLKEIKIGQDESLQLFWRPTEDALTVCNVSSPVGSFNLLNDSSPNFFRSENLRFKEGYCSVKIKKVHSGYNGTWEFTAGTSNQVYHTSTQLTVISPVVLVNQSYVIQDDRAFSLKCGSPNAIHCDLRSPKDTTWSYLGPCIKTLYDISVFDHEGTWSCSFAVPYFVREFKATTTITIKQEETKELMLQEHKNEIVFYCTIPKNITYAKMCRITTPQGVDLYLGPGRSFGRYSYYGSSPSYCGVSIPKPLTHDDIGPWKCQLIVSTNPSMLIAYGGYQTIGQDKQLRKIEVPSKRIFWTGDTMFPVLLCHVPYIIKYCWFRSPNGSTYSVQGDSSLRETQITSQGFKFGDCALPVKSDLKKNATGTWTCNIGLAKESVAEISESFEVVYSDIPMLAKKKEVSGELGSSVEFGCQTGEGKGIGYCRLIRPDGLGMTVDPGLNNSDYSYSGKGFKYGDCSIAIGSLKPHDIGTWHCSATLSQEFHSVEYSTKIKVMEEKGSLILLYLIVGFGVLLTAIGTSYLFLRRFDISVRRRQEDSRISLLRNGRSEHSENSSTLSGQAEPDNATSAYRRRTPQTSTTNQQSSLHI